MASFLDSLFAQPEGSPLLKTTDYSAAAKQGADYNQSQIGAFEGYAPGFTDFIKNLYGSTVNPQATQAQNTQFSIGSQLANQGYTNAQTGALDYFRQKSLESAAASGAPLTGSFAQGNAANIGMQQVLGNQLQGVNLLNGYAQNQQNLAQSFMQPSQGILNSSLVSPTAFMQGAAANNNIDNQNAYIGFANSQQNSWFDNVLTGAAQSLISTPFSLSNNINSATANSPQTGIGLVGSICGGSQPASNTTSPYNSVSSAQANSGSAPFDYSNSSFAF